MKSHTQAFKNEVASLGKQQMVQLIYTTGNETTILMNDSINSMTLRYQGSLLKSVMKQLEVECTTMIPVGTEIQVMYGLFVNNTYEYLNYGKYIVKEVKKQEDKRSYTMTCYDKILNSMKNYEAPTVSYPTTVRNYITAVCAKIGLTFANAQETFPNYSRQIPEELYLDSEGNDIGYTFRDVLDELAQVTASTICINNSGQLELRYLTETNDTIDENYFKDINVEFGQKYGPINSIVLSRSGQSDNVYLQDEESVETNGLCEIKITDNQIMNFNDRSDYLPDILEALDGIEYYLNDYTSTGILYYELCDKYTATINGTNYACVMLNDEINITQGLEEVIYTENPEDSETDYTKADKTDRRINQAYIIVDKQNQTIEAVTGRVTTTEEIVEEVQGDVNTLKENAVTSVVVEYALGDNVTTPPATGWSEVAPVWTADKYMWQRTTTTYADGTTATSDETCIAGARGQDGAPGQPGAPGEPGNGYVYIEATQTGTTATWTGTTTQLDSITEGTQILYHLTQKSSSNVTLNLTLSDGTSTGAKNVYFSGTTRLGTQFDKNAMIGLIYDGTDWRVTNPYTNTYDRVKYNSSVKAKTAITASSIIVGDANGYAKAAAGLSFDINYPILWATSSIQANAVGTNNYLNFPTCTLRNNKSGITLTQYAMAYLVGSLNGTTFTIDDVVFENEPTQATEKLYIPVGVLSTTYQIYFTGGVPTIYSYGENGFDIESKNSAVEAQSTASDAQTKANDAAQSASDASIKAQDASDLADSNAKKIKKVVEEDLVDVKQDVSSINTTITGIKKTQESNTTDIATIKQSIEGIKTQLKHTGGNNIFRYKKEFWDDGILNSQTNEYGPANLEEYSDTDTQLNSTSNLGYIISTGTSRQVVPVGEGKYTISFKYKKLISGAECRVVINGVSTPLEASEWTTFNYVYSGSSAIDLEFYSDTDSALKIVDVMGNVGSEATTWTQNPNETITDTVTIGKGIQIESSTQNTYTRIDNDGNRTFNRSTNEVVMEATDKGVTTKYLTSRDGALITSLVIQEVNGQVWLSEIGGN